MYPTECVINCKTILTAEERIKNQLSRSRNRQKNIKCDFGDVSCGDMNCNEKSQGSPLVCLSRVCVCVGGGIKLGPYISVKLVVQAN